MYPHTLKTGGKIYLRHAKGAAKIILSFLHLKKFNNYYGLEFELPAYYGIMKHRKCINSINIRTTFKHSVSGN